MYIHYKYYYDEYQLNSSSVCVYFCACKVKHFFGCFLKIFKAIRNADLQRRRGSKRDYQLIQCPDGHNGRGWGRWEAGAAAQSQSPPWVAGTKALGASSSAFPGNWVSSGAAWI